MKSLLTYTFLLSFIYSINSSQNGVFTKSVLENFARQEIGSVYGNNGWIKKIQKTIIENNRNTQLEFNLPVLLAKYSDVNEAYFSENDFQNLLFDNNSTGNMKGYYNEISYGNITIYDMMGKIVKTLVNGSQTAGFKSVQWNATNNKNEPVSAGLYLYTIQVGEFTKTKKMVLLK